MKRFIPLLCLAIIVGAMLACTDAGKNTSNTTKQEDTSKPKTWQQTHTFNGNGQNKTEKFTVADEWKIAWTCDPTGDYLGQYPLSVTVYTGSGTYKELAINGLCKEGNTSGETSLHDGGEVYLDISSTGKWDLVIHEQK